MFISLYIIYVCNVLFSLLISFFASLAFFYISLSIYRCVSVHLIYDFDVKFAPSSTLSTHTHTFIPTTYIAFNASHTRKNKKEATRFGFILNHFTTKHEIINSNRIKFFFTTFVIFFFSPFKILHSHLRDNIFTRVFHLFHFRFKHFFRKKKSFLFLYFLVFVFVQSFALFWYILSFCFIFVDSVCVFLLSLSRLILSVYHRQT